MSYSVSSSSSTSGSFNTPPSVKKKRGRPPKPNSLSNKITTTMNIIVNTSPSYNSPTAENNSNMIVKRGAPDIFTPLMRVSPNSKRKRSRKSSVSSDTSNGLRKSYKDGIITPLSGKISDSATKSIEPINPKVMDNIAYITGDLNYPDVQHSNSSSDGLSSIGRHDSFNTSSSRSSFTNPLLTPTNIIPLGSGSGKNYMGSNYLSSSNELTFDASNQAHTMKGLLPPASLPKTGLRASEDRADDFSLQLMVDESGKAVLSNEIFNSAERGAKNFGHAMNRKFSYGARTDMNHQDDVVFPPQTSSLILGLKDDPLTKNFQLEHSAHNSHNIPVPGTLKRHHSDITGINAHYLPEENALSTINENQFQESHYDKIIVPGTPSNKDIYSTSGSGLSQIELNMTPNFNSFMNSIATLNSPQQKKMYNALYTSSNEGSPGSNNQGTHFENGSNLIHSSFDNTRDSQGRYVDMSSVVLPQNVTLSSTLTPEDAGDARSALRKIISIKRK